MAAAAISALKFKIALVAWDLKLVIAQIVKFIIGLKALTIAQIKANIAAYANPYVALAAGLTAAAIAAHRFATAQDRLIAKLNDGSATEEDVNKIFNRRLDIQRKITELENNDSKAGKASRINKIAKLKEEYATLTEAIEDYRKAQNGSTEDLAKLKKEFEALLGGGDGGDSPFAKFAQELENFDDALEQVAVNGFKKLEDSILQFVQTGKLAIKDLVRSVIADLARLAIQQTITKPLFSAFTSLFSPTASVGTQAGNVLGDALGDMKLIKSAKGNTFARNGIVPYAKGGVIRKPTVSLMGEQGAEAILPLQRGRGGRLGVAMQGGGGGTTNVNYTGPTLNFNGDQYVPRSAVNSIVQAAATKGAALGETATMRSLQNNRSARGRLGM
jgi:lambda family phage tail tape measure protein